MVNLRDRLAIKIPEAVVACGLSRATLYELMAAGDLPFVKVGASRLIRVADLEAFLAGKRVGQVRECA